MPFAQPFPRNFSTNSVREFAPAQSGVYGISNANEWIYIGEADNILEALLLHLRDLDTSLQKMHPTGFVFEVCDHAGRSARQDRLVLEYEPTCNRRWPERRDGRSGRK
jgi:hypothetical protein